MVQKIQDKEIKVGIFIFILSTSKIGFWTSNLVHDGRGVS